MAKKTKQNQQRVLTTGKIIVTRENKDTLCVKRGMFHQQNTLTDKRRKVLVGCFSIEYMMDFNESLKNLINKMDCAVQNVAEVRTGKKKTRIHIIGQDDTPLAVN